MVLQLADRQDRAGYAARRLAEFAELCRQSGLAVTPQRMAIIGALLASPDHPRADRVFAMVRRRYPHMSLATVHRTLETLCEMGEARKVSLHHDSARYDANLRPHHHVVCIRCRVIRDIESQGLDQLLKGSRELAGFKVLSCAVEVQALCARCQRRAAKESGAATGVRLAGNRGQTNQVHV
jgi:Fur family peroxide stress response transcriptional regulator